jgi:hypothetical protein
VTLETLLAGTFCSTSSKNSSGILGYFRVEKCMASPCSFSSSSADGGIGGSKRGCTFKSCLVHALF